MFQLSGLRLITKKIYQGRHRTLVKDATSNFDNALGSVTYDLFNIEDCIVIPASESTMQVLDEGLRNKTVMECYTDTYVTSAIEDTNVLGDQIQINIGKGLQWFSIKKVESFILNDSLLHYKFIAVLE